MSEGRKRSRKSKLEVRSGVDDADEAEHTLLQCVYHYGSDTRTPEEWEIEIARQRKLFKIKQSTAKSPPVDNPEQKATRQTLGRPRLHPVKLEVNKRPSRRPKTLKKPEPVVTETLDQSSRSTRSSITEVYESWSRETESNNTGPRISNTESEGSEFRLSLGQSSSGKKQLLRVTERAEKSIVPGYVGKGSPDVEQNKQTPDSSETVSIVREPKDKELIQPLIRSSTIFDHTYSLQNVPSPRPQSPIQLSVKVEVEEFDESIMEMGAGETKEDLLSLITGPSSGLIKPNRKRSSPIRAFHVNLDKVYKIADHIMWSSINPADKYLGIELKNIWGRVLKPEEDTDPHNKLIQKAINTWGLGLIGARAWREPPLFYQCHLCYLAWWYLDPFRDHIRSHDHKELKVYLQDNLPESIIVACAPDKNSVKIFKCIPCEGDCYRCGKTYDHHIKTAKHMYICEDCSQSFPTCSLLQQHHQICLKKPLMDLPHMRKCSICITYAEDLEPHMNLSHMVRSDIPSPFSSKVCAVCHKIYQHFHTHMCIKSSMNSCCVHCYRKFPTKMLSEFHIRLGELDYQCKTCKQILPWKCMETEHMLTHTDKFKMVYKCVNSECPPTMLFPDEISVRLHKTIHHKQKHDKRRTYYEMVVIPEQTLKTSAMVDLNSPAVWELDAKNDMEMLKAKAVQNIDNDNDDSDANNMDYEQVLARVFNVSDSVRKASVASAGEISAAEIQTEQEKLAFEKLIDQQDDPITIKAEPSELNEMSESNEPSELNEWSELNVPPNSKETHDIYEQCEVDIKREVNLCDIKMEPQEYPVDIVYNDLQTEIKMEPEELEFEELELEEVELDDMEIVEPKVEKMELVEAMDMKIMHPLSEKPTSTRLNNSADIPTPQVTQNIYFTTDNNLMLPENPAVAKLNTYEKENQSILSPVSSHYLNTGAEKASPQVTPNSFFTTDIKIIQTFQIKPTSTELTNSDERATPQVTQNSSCTTNKSIIQTIPENPTSTKLNISTERPTPQATQKSMTTDKEIIKTLPEAPKSTRLNISAERATPQVTRCLFTNTKRGQYVFENKQVIKQIDPSQYKLKPRKRKKNNITKVAIFVHCDENRSILKKNLPNGLNTNRSIYDLSEQNRDVDPNETKQNTVLAPNPSKQNAMLAPNELIPNTDIYPKLLIKDVKIEPIEMEQSFDVETNIVNTDTNSNPNSPDDTPKSAPSGLNISESDRELRSRRIYQCRKCGYANSHKLYHIHVKSHCEKSPSITEGSNYKCTKCNMSFTTLKCYLVHFPRHGYAILQCPTCNHKFESLKDLLLHFQKHVRYSFVNCWMINKKSDMPTKKLHRCQVCQKTVPVEDFFFHWESHLVLAATLKPESEPVEPEGEKQSPVYAKTLQPPILHKALQQLRSVMRERECIVCQRSFNRRHDCKRHIIEHLLKDAYTKKASTQSLICQICFAEFHSAEWYKFHMREHGGLPVYKCNLCDKAFSDSSNFAKHKKIHSLKVLICDICNKKFHAKVSMVKHMMMHQVTDPIRCVLCNKFFYSMSHYNKHVQTRHERSTKFKCIVCDLYFNSLRHKWDHMWTVHNERKQIADCPICDKRFRKYLDVKNHARLDHNVDLSFVKIKNEGVLTKVKTLCKVKKIPEETIYVPPSMTNLPEDTASVAPREPPPI